MPLQALGLVLISAFLHAAWNALLKRERDVGAAMLTLQILTVLESLAAAALVPGGTLGPGRNALWGIGSGLFEGGSFLALALAFASGTLGLVYIVARGGALILLWPLSLALLGERLTWTALAGTALVIAGLVLCSAPAGGLLPAGLGWSILCAVCIAGYSACYKLGIAGGATPMALSGLSLGISLVVTLAVTIGRRRGRAGLAGIRAVLARRPWAILLASTCSAVSFWLVLMAYRSAGAGAVMTFRNISIVFALLLAPLIGDRPRGREVAGGCLVVAGAVLVGWPH